MIKSLCPECLTHGFCKNLQTRLVTDAAMDDPEFVRDVRAKAFGENISPSGWLDHLYDLYCAYAGQIVDHQGEEVVLDLDHHFDDDEEGARRRLVNWFSETCCTPCLDDVNPRVRREARERFRILATLLRATYPERALLWGVRPANDNKAAGR